MSAAVKQEGPGMRAVEEVELASTKAAKVLMPVLDLLELNDEEKQVRGRHKGGQKCVGRALRSLGRCLWI